MNGFQSHQPGVPISLFPYVGPRVTFRDWLHSNHARAYVHSLTNIYTGRAGQGGGIQECVPSFKESVFQMHHQVFWIPLLPPPSFFLIILPCLLLVSVSPRPCLPSCYQAPSHWPWGQESESLEGLITHRLLGSTSRISQRRSEEKPGDVQQ